MTFKSDNERRYIYIKIYFPLQGHIKLNKSLI